jgi:hypothetical protein
LRENYLAWDLFRLCSGRLRPPALEGITAIDPEKAKGIVFDYDGYFEDWEKILFIDNIFLGIKFDEEQAKRQDADAKKSRR